MGQVSTIGLDIAKRVFQVHGVDPAGVVVFRRQLRRTEAWRPAPRRIAGAGRSPRRVTRACPGESRGPADAADPGEAPGLRRGRLYVKWGKKNDKSLPRRKPGSTRRPAAKR